MISASHPPLRPCTTVRELNNQFPFIGHVRWVEIVAGTVYLREVSEQTDPKLTDVVAALVWSSYERFEGWYHCRTKLPYLATYLLPEARKNAIGPMGIVVPATISVGGGLTMVNIRNVVWFEQEADAVDFSLNWGVAT